MLIGHQKQWQILRELAKTNRIPHAFLFSGQEKLGKKTLALEFIKLLSCHEKDFKAKPCQKCPSCQLFQRGCHPDLAIITPVQKEIQIHQVRDLSWKLSLRPFEAPFKYAIVDDAHTMNQEAQSAFLKTLEEPKGKALLILITAYPETLLPTILSRVQKIKFFPIPRLEIENYLKNQGLLQEKVEEIIKLSFGKPGQAIEFLKDPQKLKNQKQRLLDLFKISRSDINSRFQYAKILAKEPDNLREILDIWLNYFRKNLLLFYQSQKYSPKYSLLKLKEITKLIQNINYLISTTNINPRLALEILMLEL